MQKLNGFPLQGMKHQSQEGQTQDQPFFPFSSVFWDLALKSSRQMLRDHTIWLGEMSSPSRGRGGFLGSHPSPASGHWLRVGCALKCCLVTSQGAGSPEVGAASLLWQEPQAPMECFVLEHGADSGCRVLSLLALRGAERERIS